VVLFQVSAFHPFHDTAPGAVMHFRAMLFFPRMKLYDFIASAKPPKRPLSSIIYQSPLGSVLQASLRDASSISIIFPRAKPTATFTTSLRDSGALSHWRLGISLEFGPLSLVIFHFPSFLASQLCFSPSTFDVGSSTSCRAEIKWRRIDVQRFSRPSLLNPRLSPQYFCNP
jgi:hypothetical protein